jgi:hypothetical protein
MKRLGWEGVALQRDDQNHLQSEAVFAGKK